MSCLQNWKHNEISVTVIAMSLLIFHDLHMGHWNTLFFSPILSLEACKEEETDTGCASGVI